MKWEELNDQQCAIARFLGVMGDRWSLLILSDAFLGVRRFETFHERLGFSRTMLSDRLKKLCDNGILEQVVYQEKPTRYEYRLTKKGLDLHPVMMTMSKWSNTYCADEAGAPILFRHHSCNHDFSAQVHCSHCGEIVQPWEVTARKRRDKAGYPPVSRGPVSEARTQTGSAD